MLEKRSTSSFDRRSIEGMDLDRATKKAEDLIRDLSFKEDDFRDTYEDLVDRDLATIARIKDRIKSQQLNSVQERNQKIGAVLEALVLWNGDQNLWFGEHAKVLKTSEYDDFVNGVDMIVQFMNEAKEAISYLGLAVDVTIEEDMTDKFDRIRREIEQGEMRQVKYFHSKKMNLHGRLSNVPNVIVGINRRTVSEVAELWMNKDNKQLAGHQIQIMILLQIKKQLEVYKKYAEGFEGDKYKVLVDEYEKALSKINEILESKKDLLRRVETDILSDDHHSYVMSFLNSWERGLSK